MSPQPDDTPVTGEVEKDTIELLSEDDVEKEEQETLELPAGEGKKEEAEEGEEGDEKDEEIDELKEIEEELEGPKEEDLELVTPVRRKEILAKYPKLFKDFPYLEKAYYREQQFTEVFPTVQEAKDAVNKAEFLDRVDNEVMNGDISTVLFAAKQGNQEAFNRITDNYLGVLKHVDQNAYYHVVGGIIKDTIVTMVREARALGEQGSPLQAAANILNQFAFGSQTFTPQQRLSREIRPEDQHRQQQIQQEDQQRFYDQFVSVRDGLQSRADNVLMATISENIDPRGSMTDYVKGHAVQEAHSTLEDLIAKDTRFRSLLDRLWQKAYERGFDKSSQDAIKSAYLSKAKTLLPSVIKKARNTALRGLGKSSSNEEETESVKTPKSSGMKIPSGGGTKIRKPSDIPKGMSTLDFLNKD